jgi:hypothetical protein
MDSSNRVHEFVIAFWSLFELDEQLAKSLPRLSSEIPKERGM